MMKKSVAFLVLFLFGMLFFAPGTGFAQPGNPGGGDPDAPITGIEILLGVGGLLGVRKMIASRKKN